MSRYVRKRDCARINTSLLVSYTPLGPKNNATRKRLCTARPAQGLKRCQRWTRDTPRTPSTRCCNDEPARKRSCSQHKASHKHLKKR